MWSNIIAYLTREFMPHGACYLWKPDILLLNVVSDLLIAASYFSIPVALLYLVRKKLNLHFNLVFVMFASFIFACGLTHLSGVWVVWHGNYVLQGLIKAMTAVVSIGTAVALWPLIPRLLRHPNFDDLAREVAERRLAERRLVKVSLELEDRVKARTIELALSESRYKSLLTAVTGIVWSTNNKAEFVAGQDTWTEYTGQIAEEQLGYGWLRKIHPDDQVLIQERIEAGLNPEDVSAVTCRIWNELHGLFRHCEIQFVAHKFFGREEVDWTGMAIDIHDRRVAEEQFELAVDAAPNAMIMVDSSGSILLVNSEAERLFGYMRSEIIGKPVEQLVPIRFRDGHQNFREKYMHAPSQRGMGAGRDLFAVRKDGVEVPVEIGLNPILRGKEKYIIGSIVDISDRKESEAREREIAQDLIRSNAELDKFAYVASHDLKAPLRAIDNLSKWICEDAAESLPEKSKRHLEQMRQRVTRMEKLLDDLLLYSRARRSREASLIEEVSLNKIMSEIVDLLGAPSSFKIGYSFEALNIRTNRVALEQVLRNLIGNAIKHHDREVGEINVSGTLVGPGQLSIKVKDDGPGIEPQYHTQIFELFRTLRPRDEVEGSGMGLAIVKKLIENNGGTIEVESDGSRGTCFTFSWPIEISIDAATSSL